MRTYLVAFTISLIASLIFTRVVRDLAHRYKLYDEPSGGRKIHTRPIPRLGGIAVAISILLPLLALGLWENKISRLLVADRPLLISLAAGSGVMILVGIFDDLKGSRAIIKLLAQIAAASIVFSVGIRVEAISVPFFEPMRFGLLSLPVTIFWMVLVMNAINLIDGLDGLAGGVVVLAGSTLFIMSVIEDDPVAALLLVVIVGSTLGFLAYNVNPASIFLGDTGSLLLGFMLSLVSVHSTQKSYTLFSIVAAIIALGLPIFDLGLAVVRRFLSGQPLFRADQHHVHHLLLRKGLSQGQSVKLLIGAAVLLEGLAFLFIYADDAVSSLAILALVPLGVMAVHFLGYGDVIRNARRNRLLGVVDEKLHVRAEALSRFRQELVNPQSIDQVWAETQQLAEVLGLEWLGLELSSGKVLRWQGRSPAADGERVLHQDLIEHTLELEAGGLRFGTLSLAVYPEKELMSSMGPVFYRVLADGLSLALLRVVPVPDSVGSAPSA
jgi:UDP-GlcNAc:undecaprenyl-phosphate GlcNAc-1-phosphate transferase